jgi:MFS family permease
MKNIDKNVIYLGWVSFFTDMASSMVTTLLPIFIVYVLNEGVDKLGIIIAISTFVSYIFRILFGYFSDKYQIVKPFTLIGYFISAVTKPLLYFSTTYISVAILRSAERMGKAIRASSKDVLISSYVQNNEHGKTFGFHKMMDISGELFGALCIFVIFMFFSKDETIIRNIFAFTFIPGLIALLIIVFFVQDKPSSIKKVQKNIVINKKDFKLFYILFIYFGFIFFLMSEQFFILKAKEDGYDISIIPLFMIVLTFTQSITSYYSGILTDKIGISKSLILSFIFAIISILVININLWIAFVFLGLFTILSLNSIRTIISSHAVSKGFIFGVFYGGIAIFSSLGAVVIGFIWEIYGVNSVILFSETEMIGIFIISIFLLKTFRVELSLKV